MQTAVEYNPPTPDERMEGEAFGRVARLLPRYASAYPSRGGGG